MSIEEFILSIIEGDGFAKRVREFTPGQFVLTGFQRGGVSLKTIGYCVQVRKGCGAYGSDMVFLRHPDESLTTHENQAFFALAEDKVKLARECFQMLPEEEDYSFGYNSFEGVREFGFVIENSKSQPMEVEPFSIVTTSANGDKSLLVISNSRERPSQ